MTKTASAAALSRAYTARVLKDAEARAAKARARAVRADAQAVAVTRSAQARIDKARAAIDNANDRANKASSKWVDAQFAVQAAKVADDEARNLP